MSAAARFQPRDAFAIGADEPYRLLPFRFARLPEPGGSVLLTSDVGDWTILAAADFEALVHRRLDPGSEAHRALRSRGFIATPLDRPQIDLMAARLRTRKSFIDDGPSLAIFVVTLRCSQSCLYCQVSRRRAAKPGFDMSPAAASLAVERLFELPSRHLTVEFQGGEPGLAFDRVRQIVELCSATIMLAGWRQPSWPVGKAGGRA